MFNKKIKAINIPHIIINIIITLMLGIISINLMPHQSKSKSYTDSQKGIFDISESIDSIVNFLVPKAYAANDNYIKFSSAHTFTLKAGRKSWTGTLEYSTDLSSWTTWTGTSSISSSTTGTKKVLYIRGTGNTVITGNSSSYRWAFPSGSNISCTGNIENLLDWKTVAAGNHPSMNSYAFAFLFQKCTGLTAAPELPATTLATYCYMAMFDGCTNLTTAPELPATTLANYCYDNMFSGCTSLTTAPALQATTLAQYCYDGMFSGCTGLTTAPELPAKTLAIYCYSGMFRSCTSLTTAPVLPATKLANRCYEYMFQNCTGLTTAPALPATTLATYCYSNMFLGCTSLTTAPALPATTLTNYCYDSMFRSCTSLTKAPKLPATTLARYCYQYMFRDCTGLTTAPELPATTLENYCYQYMFDGCTGLTKAPELPATTLASYCYRYMFSECTSIKLSTTQTDNYVIPYRIPKEGTGSTASNALYYMFSSTGGTFTGTPSINTTYYLWCPALKFSSPSTFTLATGNNTKNWNGTLEYSTDLSTWSTWTGSEISSSTTGAEQVLYIRGTNNTKITGGNQDTFRWVLTGSNISCTGNIENLLDYETVVAGEHPTMSSYAFAYMFRGCTSLTTAPTLPATTLADDCYRYMFDGCTSLTTAPALPANTLATYCYYGMFYNCTSLTTAPELPATTLAQRCYEYMFQGCTSLTTAPALPATTLARNCYDSMFSNCTGLTTAPALPATTLADYCYSGMFFGCTSLTTAPALPVTTLADYCYNGMFYGCTSLTTAPALPATTLADYCYRRMFYGCTGLKLSAEQTGNYQIPYCIPTSGTGTTATDALTNMFSNTGGTWKGTPAINTTYYLWCPALKFSSPSMFTLATANSTKNWDGTLEYSTDLSNWTTWDGTSISSSTTGTEKVLYIRGTGNNVITGNSSDYKWVLTGSNISCTGNIENLLNWETVAAGNHPEMDEYCYASMFEDCTGLTTAPALPATTLANYCYEYMFYGCTGLATAPELPAETLADHCYEGMFFGCTSLTTAPELPATTLADYCYKSMFRDCENLTTAPELAAETLTSRCYSSMFSGCTSLTTAPELPATTLADYCYYQMFKGCTSLSTVPELPATTVVDYCYREMFYECTSIKLSETQTGNYVKPYRIPKEGTGTTATDALTNMFASTGGTFKGTPNINTTYYLWCEGHGTDANHDNICDNCGQTLIVLINNIPTQSGSLTYIGEDNIQYPTWSNYNTSELTIGGITSAANAGTYTATFTPKSGYAWASDGSTSAKSVTWTIAKASNPLTFTGTQTVNKSFSTSSQTATITGASNGQGTVTYAINSQKQGSTDISYFTLSGTTLTIAANTPVNTYTVVVRATAAGNDNYNSGTKDSTITVNIGKTNISPTVSMSGWTYGGAASNPSVSGNPGNGAVTYEYKVSTAADNTYTTTKPSNAGTYTVRATIAATTNYNGGTATTNFTIAKAANPLTFTNTQTVNKSFSTNSQTATITAASNGQGTVTYAINSQKQGSTNVSYFSLSGTTLTIAANAPVNTYTVVVRATAAGNDNYNSGYKDSTITVTIGKANISPTVSMSGWTYGGTASNPSVSGNPGNGAVTYEYKVSTAADNTYTTTKPSNAGTYTVRATIAATTNYNGGTATTNFTIAKAANPLTFTGTQTVNKPFSTSSQTATITAASNGQGTVTYAINSQKQGSTNVSYFSLSGTTLTIAANTPVNTYTVVVRATAAGNDNYNSGFKDSTITVNIGKTNISPTVSMSGWTYGGAASNPSVSGNPGNGAVTYEYKVSTAADDTYTTTKPSNAGTYTVRATIAATANYNSGTATTNFTIAKAANPLTFTSTQTVNKPFSTSSQTATITAATNGQGTVTYAINSQKQGSTNVSYFSLSGTTLTIAANTPANTYTVVVRATAAGNNNYNSGTKDSTITITINKADNPLTFTATQSITKTFSPYSQNANITAATNNQGTLSYAITSQKKGSVDVSYFTLNGTQLTIAGNTPAGSYTVTVRASAAGNDNYNPGSKDSTITVTINKAENPLTFTSPQYKTVTISANAQTTTIEAAANNQGALSYSIVSQKKDSANVNYFTLNGTTVTIQANTPVGIYTIVVRATAAGNDNYNSGTKDSTITVEIVKANIVPSVNISDWIYGNTPSTPSVSGNLGGGEVTYEYKASSANDSTYSTTQPSNAGSYTIRATIAETAYYNGGIATKNFTIERRGIPRIVPSSTAFEYQNDSISTFIPEWGNYNSATSTISGITVAQGITAGEITSTFTTYFTPKANYKWSDNSSTSAQTITWTITDKHKPVISSISVYDGNVTNTAGVELADTSKYKLSRTVFIDASDAESGLQVNAYSLDNGLTWQSSNRFYVDYDCSNLTAVVRDKAGNTISQSVTVNVNTDNTAPNVSITGDSITWTNTDRTITITATDANGLAASPYSFDGGTTWTSNNSKTFTTDIDTITICVKDVVGNIRTVENVMVRIDKIKPNVSNVSPQSTVYAQSRTVTITGTDNLSGIVEYCFDGENWQTENTFTYDSETILTQKVKVRDRAGNESTEVTANIYVDVTKPEVTTEGANSTWTNDIRVIFVHASDTNAGLADNPYSYDGGLTWTSVNYYTITKTTRELSIAVKDKVNNISETVIPVYVDKSGPTMTITGASNTWALSRTINITNVTDAESELHEYPYSFDGGANWTSESSRTFVETTDTIIVKVRDKFGNETHQIINVKVDTTSPSFEITGDSTDWAKTRTLTITNASDSESGLSTQAYSFDGGITWSSSSSLTVDSELTYYKAVVVRDVLGNMATKVVNVYVDAEAPTFAVTYNGIDPTSYASVYAVFTATDTVSKEFMYAYNYDSAHPALASWTSDNTALLPIGVPTVVACKDEVGNIAVKEFVPPYSLMPSDISERLNVFDSSTSSTAGYTLGSITSGYLTPGGTHHDYSVYNVNGTSITGIKVPVTVTLNGDYADGKATFLGRNYPVFWDEALTATANTSASTKQCYVVIDAANLIYSSLKEELKIYITEYIDAELNMPCNTVTQTTLMSVDIDAPTITVSYNPSSKKCSISARDVISGVRRLEYRIIDKLGNASEWSTYTEKFAVPSSTTYVEARAMDGVGSISTQRSENLSGYTSEIIILTPGKVKENEAFASSYNYRSSLFDFFIIGLDK